MSGKAKNSGKSRGGETVRIASELAAPIAEKLGLKIWDITFDKEGSLYYLRVIIERPGGSIDIDDCEAMSRPLSDALDERDPIDMQYTLEVGSPGLGRRLRTQEHFEEYMECPVRIRMIRADDEGQKEFIAVLMKYDNGIIEVETEQGPKTIDLNDTAFVKLYDDEDYE